jgi:hypothetical protein
MITEPDVVLTDYFLAIESGVLAWLIRRGSNPKQPLRLWFVVLFSATSVASLTGGTVHGFFLDPTSAGARILWPVALIALGGAALAAWGIGAHLQFSEDPARWVSRAATLGFAVYTGVVLLGSQRFMIALINYLPAVAFLLFAFVVAYRRLRQRVVLLGAVGILLSVVAAGVQQAKLGLHPRYMTHNAVYHIIQGVSLFLVFASARRIVGRGPC